MPKTVKPSLPLDDEPFFQPMSRRVIARVEQYVYHRQYDARQIIYFPDDPCDYAYWVREGRVRVCRALGDGRELTFRHLTRGDMLGDECLLDRPKRIDYAETLEPSLLCLMRTDDLRRLARDETEFCLAVTRHLTRRLLNLEQAFLETVTLSVRAKVAAALLRLSRQEDGDGALHLRVTHQEIANITGATRETVTVVLHEFRDSGHITLGNRRIQVLSPAALHQISLS